MADQSPQQSFPQQIIMPQRLEPDITKWTLQFEPYLRDLYHELLGEVEEKTEKGKKVWKKVSEKWMNERGAIWLTSHLRGLTNHFIILSNQKEERAYLDMELACKDICYFLAANVHEFEIDPAYFHAIMSRVENIVEFCMLRAIGGEERRYMYVNESIHRQYNIEPEQPKERTIFGFKI